MFSSWNAVASRGRDEIMISRSSLRIRCTQSMVVLALLAGSTVKTWSYLFLKERASLARKPASAPANGDDSSPIVDTFLKSTSYAMTLLSVQNRSGQRNVNRGSGGLAPTSQTPPPE